MSGFIIYGLPRSRTFWLSRFLSYRDWCCGHDELRHVRSMDDVHSWFSQACTGTAETAAAPWWRLVPQDVATVVVRRPVADVVESLARQGFPPDVMQRLMSRLDHKLDQIEVRVPDVLSVTFDELATEAGCRRVFAHCLPYEHDPEWWRLMAPLNLQADLPAMVRYAQAFRPQMDKITKIAKQITIAGMRPAGREYDGVEFRIEPFRDVYRDAEMLLRDHMIRIGKAPDEHAQFNLDLLGKLDDLGVLQTMTARIQDRIFGYLVTIVGPSLDSPDVMHGTHTAFYASPEVRGLGMRMLRAARDALKARGVHEIIGRAGVRGDGPRLGAAYRRLGAEPFGELWKLKVA